MCGWRCMSSCTRSGRKSDLAKGWTMTPSRKPMRPAAFVWASSNLIWECTRGWPLQVNGKRRRVDKTKDVHDHIEEALLGHDSNRALSCCFFCFLIFSFMTCRVPLHDLGHLTRARLPVPSRPTGVAERTYVPIGKKRGSQQRSLILAAAGGFYGKGQSHEARIHLGKTHIPTYIYMYIYIYVYIYMYIYIYIYIYICIYIYIHTYTYIYIHFNCMYICINCMYICKYTFKHALHTSNIYIYIYTYTCKYLCIPVLIYTYIYMHIFFFIHVLIYIYICLFTYMYMYIGIYKLYVCIKL